MKQPNKLINFCVNRKHFYTLATGGVTDFHFTGDTQSLPLYRYTEGGDRVSNITEWGLDRINAHYRREFGDSFREIAGADAISVEDVFAYTYARPARSGVPPGNYAVDPAARVPPPAAVPATSTYGATWAANCWTCISTSSPPIRTRWSAWTLRRPPTAPIPKSCSAPTRGTRRAARSG